MLYGMKTYRMSPSILSSVFQTFIRSFPSLSFSSISSSPSMKEGHFCEQIALNISDCPSCSSSVPLSYRENTRTNYTIVFFFFTNSNTNFSKLIHQNYNRKAKYWACKLTNIHRVEQIEEKY